jgi:phosphoglycerate dehydrogenase-like enzyme
MAKPNVVLLSRQGRASLPADTWTRLTEVATVEAVTMHSAPSMEKAVRLLADADLLGATNACLPHLDAELLDALPRLRGIVLYATGYDHIDVGLLESRRVGLSVVPDYATVAVAEHTIALMMALASRIHLANDHCRGMTSDDLSLRGVELAGRTIGVVGLGRIGRRVALLAKALGMRVVGTDTDFLARIRAWRQGVRIMDLPELLAAADVVTMCASHRFGAPPILRAPEIAAMRPGSFLVNAARAALVDSAAATAALRSRRLRGYAVDDQIADLSADADLLREGRLLQTGHSAWWRDETLSRGARLWGERLIAAGAGSPIDAVLWPSRPALTTNLELV